MLPGDLVIRPFQMEETAVQRPHFILVAGIVLVWADEQGLSLGPKPPGSGEGVRMSRLPRHTGITRNCPQEAGQQKAQQPGNGPRPRAWATQNAG